MHPVVGPKTFRGVMSAFPTGVAVLTARGVGDALFGMTVNSLTSVSLEPLQILVCLNRACDSHDVVLSSGAFAVSLLPASAEALSDQFAKREMMHRFDGVRWRAEATGSPVLDEALAWLDCTVAAVHPAGDHSIVIGRVEACGSMDGAPLVFHRGSYTRIAELSTRLQ